MPASTPTVQTDPAGLSSPQEAWPGLEGWGFPPPSPLSPFVFHTEWGEAQRQGYERSKSICRAQPGGGERATDQELRRPDLHLTTTPWPLLGLLGTLPQAELALWPGCSLTSWVTEASKVPL